MVLEIGSRLGVIVCLLGLHIVVIAADILFFKTKKTQNSELQNTEPGGINDYLYPKGKYWLISLTEVRQSLAPLGTTLLGIVLIWITFSDANGIYENIDSECSTRLDADISGVGIRVSIWAQIGMLILISIIGFFHVEDTGIKDIGGGLILTHFSLAIALIVQLCKRTLTSVDAAIGATILDAQNMALHVPFTAKQTLAARWQVILLVLAQMFGLAFLPVLVVQLNRGDFASDDCKCLYIFWWYRLSDCGAFSSGELSVFWIYYSVRWTMWVQSCFHAMYNAQWFHMAEKNGRVPISDLEETRKKIRELRKALKFPSSRSTRIGWKAEISRLEHSMLEREQQDPDRTVEKATIQSGFLYKEYPATISMSYMTCSLYSLTSMVVAEVTIHEFSLQPSSGVYSVGQIIAIVVSGATILRAIWSFQCLFNGEENKAFPDLVFDLFWGPWTCCLCLSEEDNEDSNQENQDAGKDQNRSSTESHHSDSQGKSLKTPSKSSQSKPGSRLQPTQAGQAPFERVQPNTDTAPTNHGSTGKPAASSSLEQGHSSPIIKQDRCERTRHQNRPRDPIYRFTFRQPFHLDAARKIYFPSFSRYWENRSKPKEAVVRHNNVGQSLKHRASAPIQKAESMRLEGIRDEQGNVVPSVVTTRDGSFVEPLTPGDKQQPPVSDKYPIPTNTSARIDLRQPVPSTAAAQIPEDAPPEPAPPITPALHKSQEDSARISSSVEGHISFLPGGSMADPIESDTKLETGSLPEDDQPAGGLVFKQKQLWSFQRNNPPTYDLEEDTENHSASGLIQAMASSAVDHIPEDVSGETSDLKTTQSDPSLEAGVPLQDSHEKNAASGPTDTGIISQARDSVATAQLSDRQVSSDFRNERDRPETSLVIEMEGDSNDPSWVSGDHRFSASSQKQEIPHKASVIADLESEVRNGENHGLVRTMLGKPLLYPRLTGAPVPFHFDSWIVPLKQYEVDTFLFLGKIIMNKSGFEDTRVQNHPLSIPEEHISDVSNGARLTISAELSMRNDFLLKHMPPGSAMHAAASRIQARPEYSETTDILDTLDVSVRTLSLDESLAKIVKDQLGTLHPAGRWQSIIGKSLYMITGIASAINLDTKEEISHQRAISGLPDASIGVDAGTKIDSDVEASDGKGKGTQTPLNSSGHREVFAYRLHKIDHRGKFKTYRPEQRAFL